MSALNAHGRTPYDEAAQAGAQECLDLLAAAAGGAHPGDELDDLEEGDDVAEGGEEALLLLD